MYVLRHKPIQFSGSALTQSDRAAVSDWILSGSALDQGQQIKSLETAFCQALGVRHAVFVFSGASAQMLMIAALHQDGRLRNTPAMVTAVGQPTTAAPLTQLGFSVDLVECNPNTFSVDLEDLERAIEQHQPAVLVLHHVLGQPHDMARICALCDQNDVILLEDAREALGGRIHRQALGSFGTAASFSFRTGNQLSAVDGGMVVTDDDALHTLLVLLRAHGDGRDVAEDRLDAVMRSFGWNVADGPARGLVTGFGMAGTEITAFLANRELPHLDQTAQRRAHNFQVYFDQLTVGIGNLEPADPGLHLAPLGFGILVQNRDAVISYLRDNRIFARPLVGSNIARLPFWRRQFGPRHLPGADLVHDHGLALPIHQGLSELEIVRIADLVNQIGKQL